VLKTSATSHTNHLETEPDDALQCPKTDVLAFDTLQVNTEPDDALQCPKTDVLAFNTLQVNTAELWQADRHRALSDVTRLFSETTRYETETLAPRRLRTQGQDHENETKNKTKRLRLQGRDRIFGARDQDYN